MLKLLGMREGDVGSEYGRRYKHPLELLATSRPSDTFNPSVAITFLPLTIDSGLVKGNEEID